MWDSSSWTRDQTHVPCISKWIRNHWTTREVLHYKFWLVALVRNLGSQQVPKLRKMLADQHWPCVDFWLQFLNSSSFTLGFPGGSVVKESTCPCRFAPGLGRSSGEGNGNPLQYILAWRIPWTQEPGGLQFMGSQRVGHDWVTEQQQEGPS